MKRTLCGVAVLARPAFRGHPRHAFDARAFTRAFYRRSSKSRRTRESALVRQSGRGLPRLRQPAMAFLVLRGAFFDFDHLIESSTSSSHSSLNLRKFSVSFFTLG